MDNNLMEINKALEILKPLSDGIDPFTGEEFPQGTPYQDPNTVRSLYMAITALEKELQRKRRHRDLPSNTGKPWSEEEDKKLSEAFDSDKSIHELSKIHQRTKGGIEARLVKLGKIPFLK